MGMGRIHSVGVFLLIFNRKYHTFLKLERRIPFIVWRLAFMRLSDNLGAIFLGVWLALTGLVSLLNLYVPILANLLPLIALVSGILILFGTPKLNKSLGFILLGVWLVLRGLSPFLYIRIPYWGVLVDLLAVAAGILILIKR